MPSLFTRTAALALFAGLPFAASADDDRRHGRHHYGGYDRHYHHHHHQQRHHWKHERYGYGHQYRYGPPRVVHHYPAPVYVPQPVYVPPPRPFPHHPGGSIGFRLYF